ncbi:transmembrane protein, putative [Medicago truncatula]|uniref:Transmembrane protein, putative n=1 Tax=Medicago truncatula TaxID=3880 RepID=A0A072TD67_MEDTR|nr:transmembrane protein, putative [Medicago truncatula]
MLLVLSVLLSLSSADMPLFLLAGVFLYCCWYRLLDMLLLLLVLMDHLLDRTPKRIDPTNRLLSTSSAYSSRTLFLPKIIPKSSGTLSALPFLVKERKFYKLMQLRISLKAGTKTVTTI